MATIATTRYEVRHLAADHLADCHVGTPTTVANETLTDTVNLIGYGNDYFNNWFVHIYSGTGSPQTRTITDFASATGVITVDAWDPNPNSSSGYELHRGPAFGYPTLGRYNRMIEGMIRSVAFAALIPQVDTSIMLTKNRRYYPVPSNQAFIQKLLIDDQRVGGDRLAPARFNSHQNFQTSAAESRLAQSFRLFDGPTDDGMWIAAVWLMLAKVGSPNYSVKVDLETDSSGLPSGVKAGTPADGDSAVVAAGTAITRVDEWVRFAFDLPIWLDYNTDFWITLVNNGGDAIASSDYVRWALDTNNAYSDGAFARRSTSSWSAVSGQDGIFRIEPYRYAERPLLPSEWEIQGQSTKQIRLLGQPESGDLLRVVGQRTALLPSSDSANVDVNGAALAWIVAGALASSIPEASEGNSQVNVDYLVRKAEQARVEIDVPAYAGSKQVEEQ